MALLAQPPKYNPRQPQNSNRRNKARDRLFMAEEKAVVQETFIEDEVYDASFDEVPYDSRYDGEEW